MKRLPTVYRLLADSDNLAADDALLETLAAGETAYATAAVATLLRRGYPAGLVGLVGLFHRLDEPLQRQLIQHIDSLFSALRESIRAKEIQTRLNAIELIRGSGNFRCCYLLAVALRDSSVEVRHQGAIALRHLVDVAYDRRLKMSDQLARSGELSGEQVRRKAAELKTDVEELDYLVAGLLEAVQAFGVHLRMEVAEAAALLASVMPDIFWKLLSQKPSNLAHATLEVLDSSDDPRLAQFAYLALAVAELRRQVARSIATRRSQAFMTELIRQAWLISDVRIRRGLASVKSLDWLAAGVEPLLELPDELYPPAVTFISACGLNPDSKVELFGDLLLLGPRTAQRAAIWGLVDMPTARSDQLLRTVLAWSDLDLSPIALHELVRRRPKDLPISALDHTRRSLPISLTPDQRDAIKRDFQEYWDKFDQLDESTRISAGGELARALPELLERLRSYMASTRLSDRLRALKIVNVLCLAEHLQLAVARLACDPDRIVRSTAMIALGQIGGQISERILHRGLRDEDKRVQANAIESLDRLAAANQTPQLRAKLDDGDNRVRANAVKALLQLKVPQAARTLLDMLEDPNRMHRASAIWLIEQLDIVGLTARVIMLADEDPDPYIRRKAAKAAATFDQARAKRGVGSAIDQPEEL